MVKFSKELEAQLIPEWKEAFVNYWQLKKHVKKIKLSRKSKPNQELSHDFGRSIFDPIRFLANKISNKLHSSNNKTEIIQVKSKSMEGSDEEDQVYQTELLQLFSEEDEVRGFFERLDDELNKVNQFYKTKESEFFERGEILNKQLEILLDLKQILSDRRRKLNAGILPHSWSSSALNSDVSENSVDSNDIVSDTSETDDVIAALERNGVNFINSATRTKSKKAKPKMAMRIDIPTITAVTSVSV